MKLDEAIKHCDEVIKENEIICEEIPAHCMEAYHCAKEHRQLANWLRYLKRARELLEATYELLQRQDESPWVLNLLEETVYYDEAECDGGCLMEDIEDLLEFGL